MCFETIYTIILCRIYYEVGRLNRYPQSIELAITTNSWQFCNCCVYFVFTATILGVRITWPFLKGKSVPDMNNILLLLTYIPNKLSLQEWGCSVCGGFKVCCGERELGADDRLFP